MQERGGENEETGRRRQHPEIQISQQGCPRVLILHLKFKSLCLGSHVQMLHLCVHDGTLGEDIEFCSSSHSSPDDPVPLVSFATFR